MAAAPPRRVTWADALKAHGLPDAGFPQSRIYHIIVADRHPLPASDAALVDVAKGSPCRCRLVHHISLEDTVLRVAEGDLEKDPLDQLGASGDEPITDPGLIGRIAESRERIANRASSDLDAVSVEEWFELNCPALWSRFKDQH